MCGEPVSSTVGLHASGHHGGHVPTSAGFVLDILQSSPNETYRKLKCFKALKADVFLLQQTCQISVPPLPVVRGGGDKEERGHRKEEAEKLQSAV